MRVLNFKVLNKDLTLAGFLENSSSVIYAPEFRNKGGFSIKCPATEENIELLQVGRFLVRDDDENFCIIRSVAYTDNVDEKTITTTGCFGNGILEQRIVFDKEDIIDTTENTIRTLLKNNIITPTDIDRIYPNFVLGAAISTADSVTGNYYKKNLLIAITELVENTNYGFKTIIKEGKFEFTLIAGKNRTLSQSTNNRIIFSDQWDNLLENEYIKSLELYKNVMLVLGEGEGATQLTTVVGTGVGKDRYEGVVDASNLSTENGEISATDYAEILKSAGIASMSLATDSFLGNVQLGGSFIYRTDFAMGDIVTLENTKIGISTDIRIIGMTETEDDNGYNIVPIMGIVSEMSDSETIVTGEVLTKVYTKDIIDHLDSIATKKPLSANQGKILGGKLDTINDTIAVHTAEIAILNEKALNKVTAVNVTGESVTINNTNDGYVDEITLEGNTIGGGGTPETPIAIQSVENTITLHNCGKNLYRHSDVSFNYNTTLVKNSNNSISVTSTTNTVTSKYVYIKYGNLEQGNYYLSFEKDANCENIIVYGQKKLNTGNPIGGGVNAYAIKSFFANGTLAIPSGYVAFYFLFYLKQATAIGGTGVFANIQLEKDTTSTGYEPYQGKTLSIPIKDTNGNDLTLRKVGTAYDSVYKENGKWYLRKVTNEQTLNGSENWQITADRFYITDFAIKMPANTSTLANLLATTHQTRAFNQILAGDNGVYLANGSFGIRDTVTFAGFTVADFKTWLSTHNITIAYELATPIIMELHADTATALEMLRTYQGITNIAGANAVNLILDITELAMGVGAKKYIMLTDKDGNPNMPITEGENIIMRDGKTLQQHIDAIYNLLSTL